MIVILKKGVKETKAEKKKKQRYIMKCDNCDCVYTYQDEDMNITCYGTYDGIFHHTKCPYCKFTNIIRFKRKYRGK